MADGDYLATTKPVPSLGRQAWRLLLVAQARLRFVVILAAVGALVAYWDTLNNYYERWTRADSPAEQSAATAVEYFCPMHPTIVRDNPREKCPVCHMDLAKRAKGSGAPVPLPAGTVGRVQLTPYRVVLAGVQTVPVEYKSLTKEITAFGTVEFNEVTQRHIAARQKGRILKLNVNFTGQLVEKGEELATLDVRYSPELTVTLEDLIKARKSGNRELEEMARKRLDLWDLGEEQVNEFVRTGKVTTQLTIRSPIRGHVVKKYQKEGNYVEEGVPLYDVADLDTVWLEAQVYEADHGPLRVGLPASATTLSLPNEVFTGSLTFIYPHLDESTRTLTARFELPNPEHRLRPGMYATVKIEVPPPAMNLFAATAPSADANGPTAKLEQGLLLAVPDNAVIDTGNTKVVYRESAPNVFDGVVVELGPRMGERGKPGAYYPVLKGVKAGDRVVTNGSFLIDAETRLNPAAGSVYVGGTGGKTAAVRPSTPAETPDSRGRPRSEAGAKE
jgi:Cu(I)/Ag(I) efflux system membrane fusion protein